MPHFLSQPPPCDQQPKRLQFCWPYFCSRILRRLSVAGVLGHPVAAFTQKLVALCQDHLSVPKR